MSNVAIRADIRAAVRILTVRLADMLAFLVTIVGALVLVR